MPKYTKVNAAIDRGDLWRAKEILQGRIAVTKTFDTELLSKYGEVLHSMSDYLEAGKYLFLSGNDDEKYQRAISLFLARYANSTEAHLFYTFPRQVYRAPKAKFPKSVIEELESRKFELDRRKAYKPRIESKASPVKDWLVEKLFGHLYG